MWELSQKVGGILAGHSGQRLTVAEWPVDWTEHSLFALSLGMELCGSHADSQGTVTTVIDTLIQQSRDWGRHCAVCCVLCAVCCVLCAVCCVLCAVCCVLCAVCCVLCAVCCVHLDINMCWQHITHGWFIIENYRDEFEIEMKTSNTLILIFYSNFIRGLCAVIAGSTALILKTHLPIIWTGKVTFGQAQFRVDG